MPENLLTESSVIPYLHMRGIIDGSAADVRLLGGGVSNVVLAVTQGTSRLVVKQSLPRLRVEAEWLAPVDRVITEGKAIVVASRILNTGPALRDSDDERFTITMDRADDGWEDWKTLIFSGVIEPQTAAEVGRQIAQIHSKTVGGAGLDSEFFRTEPFEVLRLSPYYQATAALAPDQAGRIHQLADELRTHRVCLVHGDLSPKNVLVSESPDQTWLIDWEVAHFGDPAFDLAFMLTHLLMKSIHIPGQLATLDEAIDEFVRAYEREAPDLSPDWSRVIGHVGCLLMARVLGKSPAEYLDDLGQSAVLALGRTLVERRSTDLSDLGALRERTTQ